MFAQLNFEMICWHNNSDMANHLNSTFAKLNLEINCAIIEKNISVVTCLKHLEI